MRKTVKDIILVITNTNEHAVELITQRFREAGQPFLQVNTDKLFGKHIGLELDGSRISCFITSGGKRLDLDKVKSVWHRHPTPPILQRNVSSKYAEFVIGEYRSFLWSLYTSIDAFWMNPPLSTRFLEHNKLRQRLDAVRIGLRVPATLITNDSRKILSFYRRHKEKVVLKPIRPTLFTQKRGDEKFLVFTTPIYKKDIIGREAEIRLAPVMVQENVEKKLEFRITIVGDKVFTCAIHSQDSERTKYDWRRYDFENVKHEVYRLPTRIEQKLLILMESWGLTYAAVDMILTPSGEYVFLELNPSGQWGWIEYLTRMPISQSIADLLMHPQKLTPEKVHMSIM